VGAARRIRKRHLNKLQLPLTQKNRKCYANLVLEKALNKVCWWN